MSLTGSYRGPSCSSVDCSAVRDVFHVLNVYLLLELQVGATNCINSLRSHKGSTGQRLILPSTFQTGKQRHKCGCVTCPQGKGNNGGGDSSADSSPAGSGCLLSFCGPSADNVSGVRNTVPVGSRGSSGVNACSIAGYGFCMENKRSSKLNFPSCDPATRVSAELLELWPRHGGEARKERCGQEKARERGRTTPTSCRLSGPDAPASIRALAARGGLSPSLPPAPPPRGPARAAAHLHNGGWSHERGERGLRERRIGRSALGCGA